MPAAYNEPTTAPTLEPNAAFSQSLQDPDVSESPVSAGAEHERYAGRDTSRAGRLEAWRAFPGKIPIGACHIAEQDNRND
jgi:hypothetical protein